MTVVTASAPGKIVLSGEYAVLDGAAAICMAVNRRARVTITRSNEDHHSVIAPGLAALSGRFVVTGGEFEWLDGGEDFALVEYVWRTIGATIPGGLALSLDTRELVDAASGNKLGIGSSAALAAAMTAALNDVADNDADVERVAMTAHCDFQGGTGSGVDVACSLHGGIIEYRMSGAGAAPLSWPKGLEFALLWSGVPASTGARIEKLGDQDEHASRTALAAAAERVATIWRAGQPQAILDEFRAYTRALRKFSVDHDIGIFDAGHAQLTDAAMSAGVVYKPCGAGGGDAGVVLADNEAAVASFVATAAANNFRRLEMTLDRRGVQRHREEH